VAPRGTDTGKNERSRTIGQTILISGAEVGERKKRRFVRENFRIERSDHKGERSPTGGNSTSFGPKEKAEKDKKYSATQNMRADNLFKRRAEKDPNERKLAGLQGNKNDKRLIDPLRKKWV